MSKEVFGTSHVPLSPAVRAGDFVFVSGQVPVVGGKVVEGGIGPETRAVLENVKACLALAGATMGDVVENGNAKVSHGSGVIISLRAT